MKIGELAMSRLCGAGIYPFSGGVSPFSADCIGNGKVKSTHKR
jgi:hypothetical protein